MRAGLVLIMGAVAAFGCSGGESTGSDGTGGDPPLVVVNEVMISGTDWVELYNASAAAVDLAGYALTDDATARDNLWTIPAGTVLAPGGFVVFENADVPAADQLPFGFNEEEEAALLDPTGAVVDRLDWGLGDVPDGATWGRLPDGTGAPVVLWSATPGLPNLRGTSPDAVGPTDTLTEPGPLVINELVASSEDGIDWVEVYNLADAPVDLQGWALSDDEDELQRFVFGAGATVPEAGYYVIQGKDSTRLVHFEFGLGSAEELLLTRPDGSIADRTEWLDGQAPLGSSWARQPNATGDFAADSTPTPESSNSF